MAKSPRSVRDKIVDAALKLAAEGAWRHVSLGDIAASASVSLAVLQKNFNSKTAIVAAVMAKTNVAILSGIEESENTEPARDRLLDVIMRRLDALQADKPAICSILRDMPFDPASLFCLAPRFFNAMVWTLETAGIGSAGLVGRLRVKGLSVIYLGALYVWSGDDSADQGKTLAFLDRRLRQAEWLAERIPDNGVFSRRRHHTTASDPEES